ncbi:chorismate mutase [Metschnikowia bicuspidata var. bicuspidata NRRL YB-4993]|uniref:Chorismate mutase n=1 Tax=Metschnikowia bicuspidata var. bicuspidata NRRL YB-4993 TaxID=869754 RepID=A0A1A0H9T6_9ASCO|nr:chorismate mutase [Metschnikowia bicuspidata var. bicuspidata NRRL YB-4993]OBA20776.1 chorismate mutase [Metschnikowia bicuspidata var. bicuspidata NRRL YB-4993]
MNFREPATVLDLNNIRASLVRMEETIVFGLIERSQFFSLPSVYQPNKYRIEGFNGSFMEWLLLQTEKVHSQVRRYEAPDETPFFPDQLLKPLLPSIEYPKILASYSDDVNVNKDILDFYVHKIVPQMACEQGDQNENSGSVSVCDVECLQALSRRIHFGKFVAEAKYKADPEMYKKLILARDVQGIEASITNQAVEDKILLRLKEKCQTYGTDPSLKYSQRPQAKVDPELIVHLYKQYVIPLTKKVEVEYLLRRLEDDE